MSSDSRFIENGNVSVIKEVCYPYKVPMYAYQAIVDFCSEQLANIHIKRTESEDKVYCEPIQRFMVDISNGNLLTRKRVLLFENYYGKREGTLII